MMRLIFWRVKLTKTTSGENFRSAFERLKSGKTLRLPAGASVSQNNVAKEAGCDPSALKKSRHPLLIDEIQRYCKGLINADPEHSKKIKPAVENRSSDEVIKRAYAERDLALSKLMVCQVRILELTKALADYESAERERVDRNRL